MALPADAAFVTIYVSSEVCHEQDYNNTMLCCMWECCWSELIRTESRNSNVGTENVWISCRSDNLESRTIWAIMQYGSL